ncbi:hypothetical protein O0L34_g3743 [Tuta absoluta]|nr:hypothetical protein O0L34_g3743 [Tuta absoluta]
MAMLSEGVESPWAGGDGRAEAALSAVLECLSGRELARAGAVCRAWRRAAAEPRLWRRRLHAECSATPHNIRACALHYASVSDRNWEDEINKTDEEFPEWSWRDEYVRAVAGWRHVYSLRPLDASEADGGGGGGGGDAQPGRSTAVGPTLLHAALSHEGDALAVTAEDASISIFIRRETASAWKLLWHASLVRRGWRAASRVEWAPAGAGAGAGAGEGERLLVAGPLALVERWEVLVLQLAGRGGEGGACVLARAGAAAGAGGCWASRDAFLSLELRLLAPHRAVTTVWLNSATQEEESEYTGVASPVLRVYNEAQSHISHVIVVEAPAESDVTEHRPHGVDEQFLRSVLDEPRASTSTTTRRLVVAACGRAGGPPGRATALGCWPLRALTLPRLCALAGGGLAERVARRRHAPRVDEPDPPVPSEDEVRALCSPPAALCPLQARVLGLAPHPNGRCVWAVEEGGRVVCAALPALIVLRVLSACDAPPSTLRPYYVHPAFSSEFIVSPLGDDGGSLCVWSTRSGAWCTAPPPAHVPAPCALLPPPLPARTPAHARSQQPAQLLVLAGDAILVWESCSTSQNLY